MKSAFAEGPVAAGFREAEGLRGRALDCHWGTSVLVLALPLTHWVAVDKFLLPMPQFPSSNPEVPVALMSCDSTNV